MPPRNTFPAFMALPRASSCSSVGMDVYWQLGSYSVSPNIGTYLRVEDARLRLQDAENTTSKKRLEVRTQAKPETDRASVSGRDRCNPHPACANCTRRTRDIKIQIR